MQAQIDSVFVIYPAPKNNSSISHIRKKFQLFRNTSAKSLEVIHAEVVPTGQGLGCFDGGIMLLTSGLMIAPSRPFAIAMFMMDSCVN
jgi:hypothetical protein